MHGACGHVDFSTALLRDSISPERYPLSGSIPPTHVEERLSVADVPALGKVRPEKRLHDRILSAFVDGQRSTEGRRRKVDLQTLLDRGATGLVSDAITAIPKFFREERMVC